MEVNAKRKKILLFILACSLIASGVQIYTNEIIFPMYISWVKAGTKYVSNDSNYIKYFLQITGFIVAFGVVLFRNNKQQESNLLIQKQHFRNEIKLQIFKDLDRKITISFDNYVKLRSMVSITVSNIEGNILLEEKGIDPILFSNRCSDFSECHQQFSESILKLTHTLDRYVIADRIFEIFRMAFLAVHHKLVNASLPLSSLLSLLLPIDIKDNKQRQRLGTNVLTVQNVSKENWVRLKNNKNLYENILVDFDMYLHDLRVEIQNCLLGDIFQKKLVAREQNNNERIVIANNSNRTLDELAEYFRSN